MNKLQSKLERVMDYYNKAYKEYSHRYNNPLRNKFYFNAEEKDILKTTNFKDKVVLDLGVGTRPFIFKIAKRAKKVIGLDLSEKTIDFMSKQNTNKNLKFMVGNAFNTPFPKHSFDIIYSLGLMEYIDEKNFLLLLKGMKRILKPNGIFIYTCYNKTMFVRAYNFLLKKFSFLSDGFAETETYSVKEIKKLAHIYNMNLVRCSSTMFIPSTIATLYSKNNLFGKLYSNFFIGLNNLFKKLFKRSGGVLIIMLKNE